MECVTTTSVTILLNGVKLSPFIPSWEIRQGDPLSPYLFILCMDYLSFFIEEEVRKGRWKQLKLGKNNLVISHLLFAHDLILIGETTFTNCEVIKSSMNYFCSVSCQRINFQISQIIIFKNLDTGFTNQIPTPSTLGEGEPV